MKKVSIFIITLMSFFTLVVGSFYVFSTVATNHTEVAIDIPDPGIPQSIAF